MTSDISISNYHRMTFESIIPDSLDMEIASEDEYYDEQSIQLLIFNDTLPNRNKYVNIRMRQLDTTDDTHDQEVELRKWLYVEYYALNRKSTIMIMFNHCQDKLKEIYAKMRDMKKPFKKLSYTIRGMYDILKEENKREFVQYQNHLLKIKKEQHIIDCVISFITANIELKNTSLFRNLNM